MESKRTFAVCKKCITYHDSEVLFSFPHSLEQPSQTFSVHACKIEIKWVNICVQHSYALILWPCIIKTKYYNRKMHVDYLPYKAPSLWRQFLALMSLKHRYSLFNLNSAEKRNNQTNLIYETNVEYMFWAGEPWSAGTLETQAWAVVQSCQSPAAFLWSFPQE